MELSIIVPVYNVEQYLDECITSLFNQRLKICDFEVILIDDGSTDSSLDIAYKWADKYSNIRVFHQDNQGQAIARNLGLDNARGKYIMFVDSDDYLYKDTLLYPLKYISNNDLDCIHFGIDIEEADGTILHRQTKKSLLGQTFSGENVALNFEMDIFGSMCPYIFSSDLFNSNKLRFKSGFAHEDSELCFRLFPRIKKMFFYDITVYYYRFNHNSTDRADNLNSIRRKYNSDLNVAAEINKLIIHNDISSGLIKRYRKILNSLVVSHYLYYTQHPELFDNRNDYFLQLRQLDLFPLKGSGMSLLSTLLIYFVNIKYYFHMAVGRFSLCE